MKVRSPLTFRNKAGDLVVVGDSVDAKELDGLPLVTAPQPYETKVVRDVAEDAPRAVTSDTAPTPKATKPAARKSTAKKAR